MDMDSATIVRADTYASIPWFQVSRKLAQDSRLSFDHRGLMMYLLSKPANWRVNHQDIMREGGIGRDKTMRLVKELQEFGYMEYVVERDAKGSFAGGYYRVYDLPELMSKPGPLKTRSPGKPESGKTDTYSKESITEEDIHKKVLDFLRSYYKSQPIGSTRNSMESERRLDEHVDLVDEYGWEVYEKAALTAMQYKDIRYANNIEQQIVRDRAQARPEQLTLEPVEVEAAWMS